MADAPRCSLAVCTRDRPAELARLLASVGVQTRLPDEVLVVDGSDSPVPAAAPAGLALRFVPVAPPGLTRQRNIAVRESVGELLLFVDDDCVLSASYVEEVCRAFTDPKNADVGAVLGRALEPAPCLGLKPLALRGLQRLFLLPRRGDGRLQASGFQTLPHHLLEPRDVDVLSGCAMSFRRRALAPVSFDERLTGSGEMEDVDMARQIRLVARIRYVPTAFLHHHPSPLGREAESVRLERLARHLALLHEKHGPRTVRCRAAFLWSLFGLGLVCLFSRRREAGLRVWREAARYL